MCVCLPVFLVVRLFGCVYLYAFSPCMLSFTSHTHFLFFSSILLLIIRFSPFVLSFFLSLSGSVSFSLCLALFLLHSAYLSDVFCSLMLLFYFPVKAHLVL